MKMPRVLSLLVAMTLVSSCGMKPLYSGGAQGVAGRSLAGVEVAPIAGKEGWLIRNALSERLDAVSGGTPQYRLTIQLFDRIEGLGVRSDETVNRERRTLRARYQLRPIGADDKSPPLIDQTETADAGFDVTSSEYATVAAEDSALERLSGIIADRIIARIALDAARRAEP